MSTEWCRIPDIKDKRYRLVFETSVNGFKFMIEDTCGYWAGQDSVKKFWFDKHGWETLKNAVDTQFEQKE